MSRDAALDSPARLKKEIVIFLIFLGVLLGVAGWYVFTDLKGNPNPLWGVSRHLAIGVPTMVLAGLHVVPAILLGVTSRKVFAVVGVLAGLLLSVFYFVFMISASGKLPIDLISGVMVAVPLVLWSRVSAFLKAG